MNWNRSATRWLIVMLIVFCCSAASFAEVFISVRIGPPALPVYAQPICPGPGYYWTPGYWAWDDDGGYYWVPGTWVVAPVGMLWTPGYWGWGGGFYVWHAGYWGPHIGFYGGINYGFGYTGVGFVGGEWRGRDFYYNRSVTNVSVTNVTNVYNKTVIVNRTENNVSYNGGEGGLKVQPRPEELAAEHEQHMAPVAAQMQHQTLAAKNRENFASVNQGRPAIAATARPGDFSKASAIPARAAGGAYHAPAMSPKEARGPAVASNHASSPASNSARPTGSAGKSNEGFRPFTPPNSSASRSTPTHSTGSQPTNAGSSHPSSPGKSNEGFRPFTPPAASNRSTGNTNGGNSARGNSNPGASHSQSESRPESVPHSAPAPRSAPAPHENASRPAPPPHRSSPPPAKNENRGEHR